MINLEQILNQSPFDFYFLVVDKFLDIKIPQLKNFYSIYSSPQDVKNSGALLSNPKTIEFIKNNSQKTGRKPVIVPFKPSAKIDFICKKNNWLKVSNPAALNRLFEDKIKFAQICQKNKISIVTFKIDKFNQDNFVKCQKIFNQKKIVVQSHFGWAGKSTFSADNWNDISQNIPLNTLVKFSPFLANSYTLTNNCCLFQKKLLQSPPALQLTGIKKYTNNPFTTVGRQWPSNAPKEIQNKIQKITQNFSQVLTKHKFRGFFGLDFIVNNDQVFLLECNPRLTASFAFYTQLELKQNINPLFFFHLVEFLNPKINFDLTQEQNRFYNTKIIGCEITPRDKNNNIKKKITSSKCVNHP